MRFIYDEEQVREFHNCLKSLEGDEVYFVSLSARNKYLTPEERVEYDLGRTEMFGRKLVKTNEFEDYLRTIRGYEIESGWSGRGFIPLPQKCIAIYANINTCSGKKALQEFYTNMNETLFNLANDANSLERLRYLDTELLNCFQRSRGTRKWIDIDFDAPDKVFARELVAKLESSFKENKVFYRIIETHSGYHVIFDKFTVHYNYNEIVACLDLAAKTRYPDGKAEVVRNSNEMVPLPGCLSAGFEVRFVK